MRRVKVIWDKPIDIASALLLNDEEDDYGLFQIYGHHIVFGAGSLLYIGMTTEQTFGVRFRQHHDEWIKDEEKDVFIHIGRLNEDDYEHDPPEWTDWSQLVKDTEALLINWHTPPYNSRNISDYTGQPLNVQSWGDRGSLLLACTSEWKRPRRPKDV